MTVAAVVLSSCAVAFALLYATLVCRENCTAPPERDLQVLVALVALGLSSGAHAADRASHPKGVYLLLATLVPTYLAWALLFTALM